MVKKSNIWMYFALALVLEAGLWTRAALSAECPQLAGTYRFELVGTIFPFKMLSVHGQTKAYQQEIQVQQTACQSLSIDSKLLNPQDFPFGNSIRNHSLVIQSGTLERPLLGSEDFLDIDRTRFEKEQIVMSTITLPLPEYTLVEGKYDPSSSWIDTYFFQKEANGDLRVRFESYRLGHPTPTEVQNFVAKKIR